MKLLALAGRAVAWFRADPRRGGAALVVLGVALVALTVVRACSPPERVEERREATAEMHEERAEETHEARELVRHVETREERRPDGGVVIVRVEDEREASAATSTASATTDATASEREVRVVERVRPSWRVSAQAGWSITRPALQPELYGAEVSGRIGGPVWLGVWARTDKTAGVSLAVEW